MAIAPPSARRLQVGKKLKSLRESVSLSGEQVAKVMGWSQPKISRMETARHPITVRDVSALLDLYGARDDERAELLSATARDTGDEVWTISPNPARRRQALAEVELVASRMIQYQPLYLPGLLQTPEYALQVSRIVGVADPASVVEFRMQRQAAMATARTTQFEFLLDGRALLFRPAGAPPLAVQARWIAQQAELPHVRVRIIPIGVQHEAMSPVPFTLYEFRERTSPAVVVVETRSTDLYVSGAENLAAYRHLLGGFGRQALSPGASLEYLDALAAVADLAGWPLRSPA